jgi:hypothetical protein
LDDDDNSKEMMKFKIVHESSIKSADETETSSNKQEQFEKEKDSTGGCSDVESSFNKATKVILKSLTALSVLIISQSSSYTFQIVSHSNDTKHEKMKAHYISQVIERIEQSTEALCVYVCVCVCIFYFLQ